MNKKTLIAYFSRPGDQYGTGSVEKGNTAIVARMIADKTKGDLFEIKVENDVYPNTYNALVEYAKKEKQQHARPEIAGRVADIDGYDEIFVGYPNWWGDMPMPVYSFLEKHGLTAEKVRHFCTHEGSGGVRRDGFDIYGHVAQNKREEAQRMVDGWLKKIGY